MGQTIPELKWSDTVEAVIGREGLPPVVDVKDFAAVRQQLDKAFEAQSAKLDSVQTGQAITDQTQPDTQPVEQKDQASQQPTDEDKSTAQAETQSGDEQNDEPTEAEATEQASSQETVIASADVAPADDLHQGSLFNLPATQSEKPATTPPVSISQFREQKEQDSSRPELEEKIPGQLAQETEKDEAHSVTQPRAFVEKAQKAANYIEDTKLAERLDGVLRDLKPQQSAVTLPKTLDTQIQTAISQARAKQQSAFATAIIPQAQTLLKNAHRAGLTNHRERGDTTITTFEGKNYSVRLRQRPEAIEFKVLCHRTDGVIYTVNGRQEQVKGLRKADKEAFERHAAHTPAQLKQAARRRRQKQAGIG